MSESPQHTPEPWRWFEEKQTAEPHMKFLVGVNGQGFAHTVGLQEPTDTANARLVAAAPELLEALHDMIGLAEGLDDDDPWFGEQRNAAERLNKARLVLAQAEGREVPA